MNNFRKCFFIWCAKSVHCFAFLSKPKKKNSRNQALTVHLIMFSSQKPMLTLSHLHQYLSNRGKEIRNYADDGHPWAFLMCACFIDYLVSMAYNQSSKAKDYKNFVRDFLAEINPIYNTFKYQSGAQDLPEQMYHILRCGIVHSFSLVPDHVSLKNGGRKRSIVLAHRKNGEVHLSRYTQNGMDSVLLTAEDFAEELCTLVDKIFLEMAPNNPQLKNNILDWWNHYPPIMALP